MPTIIRPNRCPPPHSEHWTVADAPPGQPCQLCQRPAEYHHHREATWHPPLDIALCGCCHDDLQAGRDEHDEWNARRQAER